MRLGVKWPVELSDHWLRSDRLAQAVVVGVLAGGGAFCSGVMLPEADGRRRPLTVRMSPWKRDK